jgi:hypothetical protein
MGVDAVQLLPGEPLLQETGDGVLAKALHGSAGIVAQR